MYEMLSKKINPTIKYFSKENTSPNLWLYYIHIEAVFIISICRYMKGYSVKINAKILTIGVRYLTPLRCDE